MPQKTRNIQWALELILILVTLGLTCLLYETSGHKITVLNLFYLPVVLAGFFLGRYRAGVLALLSVVSATVIVVLDISNFAMFNSPIAVIMAVMIWGAVLGLTAILVGTLNEERAIKASEAREAHLGVVEVLARYLQTANPKLEGRAVRVSKLCEQVAEKMRLSNKEIDDIRVAALLMDIENIEITARVIKKAVGALEEKLEEDNDNHTIHGTELVQSLGSILTGAFPLVLSQTEAGDVENEEMPFSARILRTVRAYDELVHGLWDGGIHDPMEAIEELDSDIDADHHPAVLHALEEVLQSQNESVFGTERPAATEAMLAEI